MKPYPNRLASGSRITATTILRHSITDPIEALILANPDCNRTASLQVDRYLACSEALGGAI